METDSYGEPKIKMAIADWEITRISRILKIF
jgi:hypothetical protein